MYIVHKMAITLTEQNLCLHLGIVELIIAAWGDEKSKRKQKWFIIIIKSNIIKQTERERYKTNHTLISSELCLA